MGRRIDILGNVYEHPIYGEYIVIQRVESRNNVCYYKVKFTKTGFETIAKSSHIRSQLVKDKLFYEEDLIGREFTNSIGQRYKVIRKDKSKDGYFVIVFLATNNLATKRRNNIINGNVSDSKGITKTMIYDVEKNKRTKRRSYHLYKAMLNREKTRGSIVCTKWKEDYQNFVEWLENIELPKHNTTLYEFETYKKLAGYELDKDYLVIGNSLYSPETCCLIPHDFNMALRNMDNCNIVLSKDNKDISVTNLRNFLISLGYEIKPEKSES